MRFWRGLNPNLPEQRSAARIRIDEGSQIKPGLAAGLGSARPRSRLEPGVLGLVYGHLVYDGVAQVCG